METWQLLVQVSVFVVTVIGFLLSNANTYMTIREHNEFRNAAKNEMDIIRKQVLVLEQTRPTTGELKAYLNKSGI